MAATPSPLVLRAEDYPSDGISSKEDVEKLFRSINGALGGVQGGLSGGLTFGANMNAQVKTVTIHVPSTDWTTVSSFSGSWVVNATVMYRQEGMLTGRMVGNVKSGTINTTAFTLPAALFPPQTIFFAQGAGGAFGQMHITAAGAVVPDTGATTAFEISCSWALATPSYPVLSCFPISVQTTISQPQGVFLWQLVDQTTSTAVSAPGGIHWKSLGQVNGKPTIQILNLPGLILGHTYQATLLIAAG